MRARPEGGMEEGGRNRGRRPNLGKNEAARGGRAGPASRVIKLFEASDAGSGIKHCLAAAPPCPITTKRLTNPTHAGGTASNIDAVCVNDTCITCPGEHDNRADSQGLRRVKGITRAANFTQWACSAVQCRVR